VPPLANARDWAQHRYRPGQPFCAVPATHAIKIVVPFPAGGPTSFDISPKASCTVVMNCAGKMMVEFFSTEISAMESAELKRHGMLRDEIGSLTKLHRRLVFSLGSSDLRATLALGLGFLCARTPHSGPKPSSICRRINSSSSGLRGRPCRNSIGMQAQPAS
jgi:hypothetical protein